MKINEAIAHARKVAEEYMCSVDDAECGKEHEQLAGWLEELQQYRAIGTVEEFRVAAEKQKPKTNADRIRSMCVDEMASFLSEVKADGIYFKEGMVYPIIPEVWKEWLQSEVEE